MLMNLRNALMAGKRPPYDAEVEFLESTGTQYIDTLVNADSNLSVEITMANAGTPWANANPMGAILVVSTSLQTRHHLNFGSTGVRYFYGNINLPNVDAQYKPADLIPFTFKVDSVNKIFTLGNYSTALPTYAFDAGLSYWLFGRNGTTPPYLGALRIYSAKLWNGTTLVRDFIPVRKGTVGYLYDRVSGKLFGNAGTGDFTLGPDVVPVEYIESHGTEYIDTGVIADQTTGFAIDIFSDMPITTDSSKSGAFFGTRTRPYSTSQKCFWLSSFGSSQGCFGLTTNRFNNDYTPGVRQQCGYIPYTFTSFTGSTTTQTESTWQIPGSILLFCTRNLSDGGAAEFAKMRLYRFTLRKSGAPVRSFLPVRVGTGSTWEGAMMDVLTRRIYRNQGTGAFTYGNDLKYPIPSE